MIRKHFKKQSAFTLFEVLIILIIMSILATAGSRALLTHETGEKWRKTWEDLNTIHIKLGGNPAMLQSGYRTDFGYHGGFGTLPGTLSTGGTDLGTPDQAAALAALNPASYVGTANAAARGSVWVSPYLSRSNPTPPYTHNAFGYKHFLWKEANGAFFHEIGIATEATSDTPDRLSGEVTTLFNDSHYYNQDVYIVLLGRLGTPLDLMTHIQDVELYTVGGWAPTSYHNSKGCFVANIVGIGTPYAGPCMIRYTLKAGGGPLTDYHQILCGGWYGPGQPMHYAIGHISPRGMASGTSARRDGRQLIELRFPGNV